ncbi:ADP-ribose pyrophosphatase, mitochondrial isoform X2 [Ischnura elegans]|nr:ADP-ribose pyrophosphatase, mitochondrial isoform X2 [Ischnura elegans]XP_046383929.1 ADP-ribose pyrophosphatase, mitochondrial isoform X2 [Ischnura elegans]XP_046383930.1 ADP-ribose pyrophosphatase, mitochondrial isoform X2 [Ischnura elegans]XP_046383931.1 ADP-ribose pyrophosphatase, mitochondrial isoform X2 [Ischnura elegans]
MAIKLGHNLLKVMTHIKCRGKFYPRTDNAVIRTAVPDDKVPWNIEWPEYNPVTYTAPHLLGTGDQLPSWADPEDMAGVCPKWNSPDGNVNRKSHIGDYEVHNNKPRNPCGRTGVQGRGCLGRWGPNHAADPIVTRWKTEKDESGSSKMVTHPKTSMPILQFVAIKRKDCGEWAIPGGMVDPGEDSTSTLLREFLEEALNIEETSVAEERHSIVNQVSRFFRDIAIRQLIHSGYVDDPRNTDNAWMETMAVNFHQPSEIADSCLPSLNAGSDAAEAVWVDICSSNSLYASHSDFLKAVTMLRGAHW